MAVTQIADAIVPSVFTQHLLLEIPETSALVQAGVLERSEFFDALLAGGGRTFNMPRWQDLDGDVESNVSSDNPASAATPEKITALDEIAIRQSRNQSWSAMDLVTALAGSDPMDAILADVARYWEKQLNRMVVRSLRGVFADNVANDSGDMVNNIAIGAAGTPDDTHLFSADAFIDTVQTMGDIGEELVAVAVHSVVYRRMQKLNLIDFIPDARGEVNIATFLGRRVVIDDQITPVTNGSNTEYTTYLFGANSLGLGVDSPRVGTAVDRDELAGDGGGQEFLHSRLEWLVHPRGFSWTATPGSGQVGQSPTFAELATGTNWNRVYQRRQVRIAELRTNG